MGKRLLVGLLVLIGIAVICAPDLSARRRAAAFVAACTPAAPNGASPQTLTCTFTAHETIVLFSASDTGTPVAITTDKADTVTTPVCVTRGTTTSILCGAAICDAVGGSTVVTFTTASGTFDSMHASRYTGLRTSACVTDSDTGQSPNSGNDTAAPPYTSKSFTVASSTALVGAITANNSDAAPNNGETEDSQTGVQYNVSQQHHIVSADSTMSWTWGANNRWTAVVLALAEPGSASSVVPALPNSLLKGGGRIVPMVWR